MLIIGECIHVVSPRIRQAIESRDKALIQELSRRQVEAGAHMLDLNIGPQRKAGPEVMTWMVQTVQEAVDVPLSLDTTNPQAIEAGLKVCRRPALINSTDATPERLHSLMPLAAHYGTSIIALTLAASGLPTSADARIGLASEYIFPVAMELGVPLERLFLDPLVLTINGNQDQTLHTVEAVRFFKQMADPPPQTTCGLSNISNGVPAQLRPLINRVYLTMLLGAGLDSAILDPLDGEMMGAIRVIETRQATTPQEQLYLALYDAYSQGEQFDSSEVDLSQPQLRDIVKTIQVLENKFLYAHGFLRV